MQTQGSKKDATAFGMTVSHEALPLPTPQLCLSSLHTPHLQPGSSSGPWACLLFLASIPLLRQPPCTWDAVNALPNPYSLNMLSQSPATECHSDISFSRKLFLTVSFSVRLGPSSVLPPHLLDPRTGLTTLCEM